MTDLGVVMPLYKQNPEFLTYALHSVLKQTYEHFRFVIVIDGAPEMELLVRSIVKDDPRVMIISYPTNRGVSHALNTGFDELFQDNAIQFLTWVSSDNIYYPQFLEVLRSSLLSGPNELGLVYSSFQTIDNHNVPQYNETFLSELKKYQDRPKEQLLNSSIIGVSFMYKAQFAKMVQGGYCLPPVEDYDYWLKITENCEIKYIPIELMDYRVDSTFSVSAQLKTTDAHRSWRYNYHLARHSARSRRGISPQISILFPVSNVTDDVIHRIENLYEQAFSNYVCHILDLSYDMHVQTILSQIPHPTTCFHWYPGLQAEKAVLYAAQELSTPYAMLVDSVEFTYVMDLQFLYDQLHQAVPSLWSSYYTEDHSEVGFRTELTLEPLHSNELFRTPTMIDMFMHILEKLGDAL
ncbi:glycosyltransferase [Paenibacillus sp. HJL G12]|uniref:Glycosyltransferase n=1 Tax=Paenibacillus dendrobii TaxID=2691084 RepID=A0A7X3IG99_9BACL|nr:glycosyltransferase family A protein [Paenibacillus dendrobii]MWV42736.1 glycosyltransferase [Paenibacillus dendrobii]